MNDFLEVWLFMVKNQVFIACKFFSCCCFALPVDKGEANPFLWQAGVVCLLATHFPQPIALLFCFFYPDTPPTHWTEISTFSPTLCITFPCTTLPFFLTTTRTTFPPPIDSYRRPRTPFYFYLFRNHPSWRSSRKLLELLLSWITFSLPGFIWINLHLTLTVHCYRIASF